MTIPDNTKFYCDLNRNNNSLDELARDLENYSIEHDIQLYAISAPLMYRDAYDYDGCFAILIPNRRIMLMNLNQPEIFSDYCSDFIEDLTTLSTNYDYISKIGRSRKWKSNLICEFDSICSTTEVINAINNEVPFKKEEDSRNSRLLISLLIGSINDVSNLIIDEPETLLDQVKQKIILFDGQQTKFIYRKPQKKQIIIQGLAGTGKTELLLHKLRDLYTDHKNGNNNTIFFTCFNKVLANNMKKRVTSFFNFMRVNEQIEWDSRLHIASSWGSSTDPHSGFYSYICNEYNIPFLSYSKNTDLNEVCKLALEQIPESAEPIIDFTLIDESQDFPQSFFDLCDRVTKHNIYIAGDIFQDIFNVTESSSINADYLLNNCYRTDPRTLVFAHALGFGLYEKPVIRWLKPDEWKACGYNLKTIDTKSVRISRPQINRFGTDYSLDSRSPIEIRYANNFVEEIMDTIKQIRNENPTIQPGDIAVVFPGKSSDNYDIADQLAFRISEEFNWQVIKGYEIKKTSSDALYISNQNNIKGLEFPFVICYAIGEITSSLTLRNSLYMILTRSFITSYFIANKSTPGYIKNYDHAANFLQNNYYLDVRQPSNDEIQQQDAIVLKSNYQIKSLEELIDECIAERKLKTKNAKTLKKKLIAFFDNDQDYDDEATARKKINQAIAISIDK